MPEELKGMPEITEKLLMECIEVCAFHYKYGASQNCQTYQFKERYSKLKKARKSLGSFVRDWEYFNTLEKESIVAFFDEDLLDRVSYKKGVKRKNVYGYVDTGKGVSGFSQILSSIENVFQHEIERLDELIESSELIKDCNTEATPRNFKERDERMLEDPSRKYARKKVVQHLLRVFYDYKGQKPTYTKKVSRTACYKEADTPDISLWVQRVFDGIKNLPSIDLDAQARGVQSILDYNGLDSCVKKGCNAFPLFW